MEVKQILTNMIFSLITLIEQIIQCKWSQFNGTNWFFTAPAICVYWHKVTFSKANLSNDAIQV